MQNLILILLVEILSATPSLAGGTLYGQPVFDLPPEVQFASSKNGSSTSQVLFNEFDNIEIGKVGSHATNVGVNIGRTVYDNHDIFQTYTVVDRLSLPFTLISYSMPIGNTFLSLNFGVGSVVSFLDLRQVAEGNFRKLDSVNWRAKKIAASSWYKMATQGSGPPYTEASPPPSDSILRLDNLDNALYANIWNLVSFPARLPFKWEWVKHLDIGEVMVYGANGYAEFGPSAGVVLNAGSLSNYMDSFNMSADYRIYVNGEFHIAVLREDEDHVRVKIVKDVQAGNYYGTSGSAQNARLFDGFMVFGAKITPRVSVVPFNFENLADVNKDWEEGYRFDLRDPSAQAAYDQAAIGRFAQAETLAQQNTGNPNSPVTRLFKKEATGDQEVTDRGFKIIIYSDDRESEVDNQVETLHLPDGDHKVLESVADNEFHSSFFFTDRTKFVSRSHIDFVDDKVLSIILEAWIEDTKTNGYDLRSYESGIEKIVDRGQIFKPLPIYNPPQPRVSTSEDDDGTAQPNQSVASYGSSSFYIRIDADQANIEKFIQTAEADKWKILEKVFNVTDGLWEDPDSRDAIRAFNFIGRAVNLALIPFDLRIKYIESLIIAGSIHDNWASLAALSDPEQLTRALAKQFSDPVYGFEMMQVFTNAIGGKNLPFYLNANSKGFGRFSVQEGELNTIQSLEDYRHSAGFDQPTPDQNFNLALRTLNVKVLDENRLEIDFSGVDKPQFLYFRVDDVSLFSSDTKAELVVLNQGLAASGANQLILDQREDSYGGVIAKAILAEKQNHYRVSMAYGAAEHDWGPVASVDMNQ